MAPSSRAQPIGSIYSLELRTPNVTVSANQYPQEGPTKYERYMISPGIGKNGGTGAGQHDTQVNIAHFTEAVLASIHAAVRAVWLYRAPVVDLAPVASKE